MAETTDYADSLTDPAPFGVLVNGSDFAAINPVGDRDWFSVPLTAGTYYRVTQQGTATGAGTLVDPFLRVNDSQGQLLASNDDDGLGFDSQLIFIAPFTGNFFLEAGEFGDNSSGTYFITLTPLSQSAGAAEDAYFAMDLLGIADPLPAAQLGIIVGFAEAQFNQGQLIGVQDPLVYMYETLGLLFAEDPDFAQVRGPLATGMGSDTTFITTSYNEIFGRAPAPAQVSSLLNILDFFVDLYTNDGSFGANATRINLLARGAVYGQMLGIDAEEEGAVAIVGGAGTAAVDLALL